MRILLVGYGRMGKMVEALALDAAYVSVGKHLGLPTQSYLAFSDAKLLDAQAGAETYGSALLAALAGILHRWAREVTGSAAAALAPRPLSLIERDPVRFWPGVCLVLVLLLLISLATR